jgi:hypothetical protein
MTRYAKNEQGMMGVGNSQELIKIKELRTPVPNGPKKRWMSQLISIAHGGVVNSAGNPGNVTKI